MFSWVFIFSFFKGNFTSQINNFQNQGFVSLLISVLLFSVFNY